MIPDETQPVGVGPYNATDKGWCETNMHLGIDEYCTCAFGKELHVNQHENTGQCKGTGEDKNITCDGNMKPWYEPSFMFEFSGPVCRP